MGTFVPEKQHADRKNNFYDDDELIFLQIIMDSSERQDIDDAIKNYISKQNNSKTMYCPHKHLQISEFARDIVNGMIWDDIKDEKVHP